MYHDLPQQDKEKEWCHGNGEDMKKGEWKKFG